MNTRRTLSNACWRRFARFSLTALFGGATVVSLLLGHSVYVRRQHALTFARLIEDDALIYDEFYEPIGPNVVWELCCWRDWNREHFAEHYPYLVTRGYYECFLQGPKLNGTHLELLPKLLRLETVRLHETSISPNDVASLSKIPTLVAVYIVDGELTQEVIPILASLKQVEYMYLSLPQVDEQALRELAINLPDCEVSW